MADQAEKEVCARDKLLAAERLPAWRAQAAIAKVVEDCQVQAALCSKALPSFLPSFRPSFLPPFLHSSIRSPIHSSIHSFIPLLFIQSFMKPLAFMHPLLHSLFSPSVHSFYHAFIHSFIVHLCIYSSLNSIILSAKNLSSPRYRYMKSYVASFIIAPSNFALMETCIIPNDAFL